MEDNTQHITIPIIHNELRAFIAEEVQKALSDRATLDALLDAFSEHCMRRMANQLRMQSGYSRSRYGESKKDPHEDLPDWVRG